MRSLSKRVGLFFSAVLLLVQMSCSNSPTSSEPTGGLIKISIKSVGNTSSNSLNKSASFVTLTSVRVVIEEIEFENSLEDSLDFELEEPFVRDLLIGSTIQEIETIQVPFGSYKEMEIEIDELGPDDGAVYSENPQLQDISIYAAGFVTGNSDQTFIFTTDLEAEQEQEFDPPLVLDENSLSTNVVLTINMDLWFVDENGSFLDPRSLANKSKIEGNIKNSIDAFEDEDDDGEKDDNDDDNEDDDDNDDDDN